MIYVRVRDKKTRHHYDVLKSAFDPTKHELVKRGKHAGESRYARPVKLNVKRAAAKPTADSDSGKPSGDNEIRKET